jgi:TolA-binding protein
MFASPWGAKEARIMRSQLTVASDMVANTERFSKRGLPISDSDARNIDGSEVDGDADQSVVASAESIFQNGGKLRQEGRFDEADALLSAAISRFPDNPLVGVSARLGSDESTRLG